MFMLIIIGWLTQIKNKNIYILPEKYLFDKLNFF
jgi:hypothetical protein